VTLGACCVSGQLGLKLQEPQQLCCREREIMQGLPVNIGSPRETFSQRLSRGVFFEFLIGCCIPFQDMSDITRIKATETLASETIVLTRCSSDSAKINNVMLGLRVNSIRGSNTKWRGWHWISRASVKGHFYPSGEG